MRLAVLMTCHDRREKTVACLAALGRAGERVPGLAMHVFLTDDGSRDGSAEAARSLGLPLTVLQGDGSLYWNGGMVRAWEAADASGMATDAYLLLNDDTLLDEDSLARLTEVRASGGHEAIVVGAVRAPDTGAVSYGGVRRTSRWHPGRTRMLGEKTDVQEADTFNANCVLIPRSVRDRVGTLDPAFTHGMGDYDYGLRARAEGVRVLVAPGTVGVCSRNDPGGSWRAPGLPLKERLRRLAGPKGIPRREWTAYLRRHGAPLPWLLAWLPTLRALAGGRRAPGKGT